MIYSAKALAADSARPDGPIREPMLALVDDGLMEAVPNKGVRTVPLTPRRPRPGPETRVLLDVPVVARLARGDLPGDRAPGSPTSCNTAFSGPPAAAT